MGDVDKSITWVDDNPDTINLVSSTYSALRLTLVYKPVIVSKGNDKEYKSHSEFITLSDKKTSVSMRLSPNINYKLTVIDEKNYKTKKDLFFPVFYIQALRNTFYGLYYACINSVFGRFSTISDNNMIHSTDDNGQNQYKPQEYSCSLKHGNTILTLNTSLDRVTVKSVDYDDKGEEYNVIINSITIAEFLSFATFMFEVNPYDTVLQMMNYIGGSPNPGKNSVDLRPTYNNIIDDSEEEEKNVPSMTYKKDDYGLETLKKPTINKGSASRWI